MLRSLTAGGSFNATRLDSRVRHPTARPRPYALEPDLYWLYHDVACASGRSEPFLSTEPNIVSDQSQMQLTIAFLYLPNRPKTSGCCPSTSSKTSPNTSSSCQGKFGPSGSAPTRRYNADALDDADKDILITFTIVFLSPGYVNNPFMKAKLVSVSPNLIPLLTSRACPTESSLKATGEKVHSLSD